MLLKLKCLKYLPDDTLCKYALIAMIAAALYLVVPAAFTYYYNTDEAWYYHDAYKPSLWEALETFRNSTVHAPLGIVRVYLAMHILDQFWFIRLTSVMFYIGTAIAAYMLGRTIHTPMTGVLLASILLFSPQMIELSIVLRGYIMLVFWLVIGLLGYYRYERHATIRNLLIYGIGMTLAVLSEYVGIVIVFSYFLAHLTFLAITRPNHWRRHTLVWMVANAMVGGIFVISYLSQSAVVEGVGWERSLYFPDYHRITSLLFLLQLPFILGASSLIAYMLLLSQLNKRMLYSEYACFHIITPAAFVFGISYVLDFIELFPLSSALRYTVHLVVVYGIALAFFSTRILESFAQYRRPTLLAMLLLTIVVPISKNETYGDWNIKHQDFLDILQAMEAQPAGSVILLDTQGYYMLTSIKAPFVQEENHVATMVGNSKAIYYPEIPKTEPAGGFFMTPSLVQRFMASLTAKERNESFYLLHYAGDYLCADWKQQDTHTIFTKGRIALLRVDPPYDHQSLEKCNQHEQ